MAITINTNMNGMGASMPMPQRFLLVNKSSGLNEIFNTAEDLMMAYPYSTLEGLLDTNTAELYLMGPKMELGCELAVSPSQEYMSWIQPTDPAPHPSVGDRLMQEYEKQLKSTPPYTLTSTSSNALDALRTFAVKGNTAIVSKDVS